MRKWLKIWMLAVALLATTTAIISTGKVNATTGDNKVQVVIWQYNDWQNTCSWGNFYFNFNADTTGQTASTGNVFECKFWDPSQKTITLELSWDLKATTGETTYILSWENVKLTNEVWWMTPNGLWSNSTITTWDIKWHTQTLFDKVDNMVWDASGNVVIEVTVPAWQPGGTYEGTLVLTF